MKQTDIQKALRRHFSQKGWMFLNNVYLFSWESDFCCQIDKKYWIEVEVKVSRQDFKRDFTHKQQKHVMLAEAFTEKKGKVRLHKSSWQVDRNIPHRFYFCAPKGMIRPDELPAYAGLIELELTTSGHILTSLARRPKTIHEDNVQVMSQVAVKQHFRLQAIQMELDQLRDLIKTYRRKKPKAGDQKHRNWDNEPHSENGWRTPLALLEQVMDIPTILKFCEKHHVTIDRGSDWQYNAWIDYQKGDGCYSAEYDAFSALVFGVLNYIKHKQPDEKKLLKAT